MPGKRALRHVVAWRFADGTSAADEAAVIDGLRGTRVVAPTRSMAAGANLALSTRSMGLTHMYIGTWDDLDGLEKFREDTVYHAPAGLRLRQHVGAPASAFDVIG
ncbi:MAG: Dabb family protein [Deltaproteobacteria bacterium]